MYLNETDPVVNAEQSFEPGPRVAAWTDIFRRNNQQWIEALIKYRVLIIVVPFVMAALFFIFRTMTTSNVYSSSCALKRSPFSDIRNSGLPVGYRQAQLSVIFNMMRNRKNLEETLRRLHLDWSTEALFNASSIKQAAKGSEYFNLSVSCDSPSLAAELANTMADVFLDDYKSFIREQMLDGYKASVRNSDTLEREVNDLHSELKKKAELYNSPSLEMEFDTIDRRIALEHDRVVEVQTRLDALNNKLVDLESQIVNVPENIEVYSETNTTREQQFTALKTELIALQQRYTDSNPQVIQLKHRISVMEAELAREAGAVNKSKVVMGRNPEYNNLKSEIMRTHAEINAEKSRFDNFQKSYEDLRDRLALLESVKQEYMMIKEQIAHKKELLLQQDETAKNFEMFLDRSFSDIDIDSRAAAASRPAPRKRGTFALLGFILGGMMALVYALGRELFDLSVRSRIDLTEALHIHDIGDVPVLTPQHRADYYSALQGVVTDIENILDGGYRPSLISVASQVTSDVDDEIFDEIVNLLTLNDLKILRIRPLRDLNSGLSQYLINDFLYGLSDELPKPDHNGHLYFMIDDMAFIAPSSGERISGMKEFAKQYDLIIWELFDYDDHPQLFSEVCSRSDLMLVPLRAGVASKLSTSKMLRQIRSRGVTDIYGMLFGLENKNFHKVS